jgi:glycosyltransferase involved in cell wall biosynthesis
MRILIVSEMIPCLPSHDGFRLIPANLICNLFERHEIHLIALSSAGEGDAQAEWPRAYCRSVSIFRSGDGARAKIRALTGAIDPALRRVVAEAVEKVRPDVMHVEGGGLAALLRSTSEGLAGLLSVHDSKALRYREFAGYAADMRARLRLKVFSSLADRQERRWFRYADRVVVTSPADGQALAAAVDANRIAVIPNGVDLEYFAYRWTPEAGRIVFTGNMSWPPNEDAAEHFARELMPAIGKRIPGASFWIVGAQPSPRVRKLAGLPGVHVTGTVDDIRPWISSAAVYASPLRFGLGVKNKILEAMASGAPIVTTLQSLSGTPLSAGRHAMIAEGDAQFVDAVVKLLEDPALCKSLSLEARRKVESENSWSSVATQYEDAYRAAMADRESIKRRGGGEASSRAG